MIRCRRIVTAGTRAQLVIPVDADGVDVQGGTIRPGLINAHVHAAYDEERPRTRARGGVTAVRDLSASAPYDAGVFRTSLL